jgi:hypothetical protein
MHSRRMIASAQNTDELYLLLKEALNIQIICRAHKMINTLLDRNPIRIGTDNITRKVAKNLLKGMVLCLK